MLRIRYLSPQDLPLVQAWARQSAWESLSEQERAVARPELLAQYADGLLQMLTAHPPSSALLIAELAGQPVGYILGGVGPDSSTGEPHAFLFDLFVLPAARRRGIARALQRAAEAYFARMGIRKVKVWSGMHNQAAIHMATSSGFKPEGLIGVKVW